MKYFLLFSILFFNILYASQNKEVLLIHSYHKGYAWTDDISKAIDKNFSEHKDIELTTVYMDTKRIDDSSYLEDLSKLYKQRIKNTFFYSLFVSFMDLVFPKNISISIPTKFISYNIRSII